MGMRGSTAADEEACVTFRTKSTPWSASTHSLASVTATRSAPPCSPRVPSLGRKMAMGGFAVMVLTLVPRLHSITEADCGVALDSRTA